MNARLAITLTMLVACAFGPRPLSAQSDDAAETEVGDGARVVEEVAFDCDLRRCNRRRFREDIAGVAGVAAGPVSDDDVSRGASRIMETGFFTSVTPRYEATETGTRLVYVGAGAITIRKVRVRAGAALGTELRRRIFLRAGETWTGERRVIERQEAEIVAYYERQGYFGTTADVQAVVAGDHTVDLIVNVTRGRRVAVDRIYVRGHEAMSFEEVEQTLLDGFNLARRFTVERFEEAQESLVRRYRELGYIQARVVYDAHIVDTDAGTVDLFVEVREGPIWEIVFNGNTLFTDAELLEDLTFYQTGFVDDAEIGLAVAQIQSRYETVGHFFVDVRARTVGGRGNRESRLAFDITEGQPAEITRIGFAGRTAIPAEELREAMATSEYSILSPGGYLQRSLLDQDVDRIEALYRREGYLSAMVTRAVLVADDARRELSVTLHIEEGPQTLVSDTRVTGLEASEVARIRHAMLRERARNERVAPYNQDALAEQRAQILSELHTRGFPFAEVESRCETPEGEPIACPDVGHGAMQRLDAAERELACARARRGGRVVEECRFVEPDPTVAVDPGQDATLVVVHEIEPGRSIVFGRTLVRGNYRTRRSTVAREMNFEPGDPYDPGLVLDGQAHLRSLNLFDSVRVTTFGTDGIEDPGVGHVVVQLEEAGSRFFEHRISLEARAATGSGALLILSNEPTLREVNLFGRAKELSLFGNFDLDIVEPGRVRNNEFRAGAGIRYVARRFYVSRRMRDPWEAQAQLAYDYDLLAVAPAPLTKELAFDARVREEFDAVEGLFFELGLNVSATETLDQSDPAVENTEFEPAFVLSIAPRVTYDSRRENPLNPTRGIFAELEVELADDFISVLDSERFTKVTARMSGFVPLGRGFVLGLNGRLGAAVGGILSGFSSQGRFALPLAERYSLGGVTTLRGFAEGGITSRDTDAFGGDFVLNGNIELRYPFLEPLALDAAVFVDVGQLAAELDEFAFSEFRVTTGVGLRWIVADLIPVVIDYGAVLGRRPGEGFGRLHFNVGYTF